MEALFSKASVTDNIDDDGQFLFAPSDSGDANVLGVDAKSFLSWNTAAFHRLLNKKFWFNEATIYKFLQAFCMQYASNTNMKNETQMEELMLEIEDASPTGRLLRHRQEHNFREKIC